MDLKTGKILLAATLVFLSACTIDGRYGHVEKVRVDVPASPEIHGAGHYQKPNTKYWRAAASVHLGREERANVEGVTNKLGNCYDIEHCRGGTQIAVDENVDAEYRTVYPVVSASLENLRKEDLFLWSWGFGINRGIYGFGTLGLNSRHFEVGVSLGLWIMAHDQAFSGSSYSCVKWLWDKDYHLSRSGFAEEGGVFDASFLYGLYAGAFFGKFSFLLSAEIYRPNLFVSDKDIHADFELPYVITEFLEIGYWINEKWEVYSGVANILGDFEGWHFSALGGVRFYWI